MNCMSMQRPFIDMLEGRVVAIPLPKLGSKRQLT